jgi:hypothetical protein
MRSSAGRDAGLSSGRSCKKLEVKARDLPCPNIQLDAEYRKVGRSWSSKLLPDF